MVDEADRPPKRHLARLAMLAAVLAVLVCAGLALKVATSASTLQKKAVQTSRLTDDTVVATLRSSTAALPPELRQAVAQARTQPDDKAAALTAARAYLEFGRSVGDARFAGASLGLLERWIGPEADAATLNLAASARQYSHDFAGALELLDRVIERAPSNAQGLLSRANIHIVQGRLARAADDCTRLAAARRMDLAILCDTTVRALSSDAPAAYSRLSNLLESGRLDPALAGYAHSLLGEIDGFLGRPAEADQHLASALAKDPSDIRSRMILADRKLDDGDAAAALDLLSMAPATDSVLVRRALAYRSLRDDARLAEIRKHLKQTFELQVLIGETAHSREQARFWLHVETDPHRALQAAAANWRDQRELEDALLLVTAAHAAGAPHAAQPVADWAIAEGIATPGLTRALNQLGIAAKVSAP